MFHVYTPFAIKQRKPPEKQVVGVSEQSVSIACVIQSIPHTPTAFCWSFSSQQTLTAQGSEAQYADICISLLL